MNKILYIYKHTLEMDVQSESLVNMFHFYSLYLILIHFKSDEAFILLFHCLPGYMSILKLCKKYT